MLCQASTHTYTHTQIGMFCDKSLLLPWGAAMELGQALTGRGKEIYEQIHIHISGCMLYRVKGLFWKDFESKKGTLLFKKKYLCFDSEIFVILWYKYM